MNLVSFKIANNVWLRRTPADSLLESVVRVQRTVFTSSLGEVMNGLSKTYKTYKTL